MFTFECQDCGHTFEKKMSLSERESGKDAVCEKCGSARSLQVFQPLAVLAGVRGEAARACQPGGCACFPDAN